MDQAFQDITSTKHQQRYNLKHSNNEEDGNLEEQKSHHLTSLREKKHCPFSIRVKKVIRGSSLGQAGGNLICGV